MNCIKNFEPLVEEEDYEEENEDYEEEEEYYEEEESEYEDEEDYNDDENEYQEEEFELEETENYITLSVQAYDENIICTNNQDNNESDPLEFGEIKFRLKNEGNDEYFMPDSSFYTFTGHYFFYEFFCQNQKAYFKTIICKNGIRSKDTESGQQRCITAIEKKIEEDADYEIFMDYYCFDYLQHEENENSKENNPLKFGGMQDENGKWKSNFWYDSKVYFYATNLENKDTFLKEVFYKSKYDEDVPCFSLIKCNNGGEIIKEGVFKGLYKCTKKETMDIVED